MPVGIATAFRAGTQRNGYYNALGDFRHNPTGFAQWWAGQVAHAARTAIKLTAEVAEMLSRRSQSP